MTKVKVGQKWRHDEWSAPREVTAVCPIVASFIGGGMSLEDGMPQFPERWTLVEDVPDAPADPCPVVEMGQTWSSEVFGLTGVVTRLKGLLATVEDSDDDRRVLMSLDGETRLPAFPGEWTFVSGPKREEPQPAPPPPPRCAPGCRPDAPCRTKDVCPVWSEEVMVKGRRLESAFQARMFAELASNWGLSGNDPGRIPDYWAQRNARLQAELRRGRR